MSKRSNGFPRRVAVAFGALVLLLAVAIPSMATLPGSHFESGDGNLVVNTAGLFDWNNPIETIACGTAAQIPHAGTNCGTDLTKSTSDNSFGQGSKEDIPVPSVVSGSIPPNKSDLTRFYVNHEKSSGIDYLYLAWERSNVLGSANMDFEFNQSKTLSSNNTTPVRTAGDMLVTFDFTNGGGNPVLGLLRWLTVANGDSKSDCFSANALPCWGANPTDDALDGVNDNRINLSAAGIAEGAVNTANVVDTNPPLSGPTPQTTLAGLTFGEAGINLTDAGVFQSGECTNFGSAFLKSRSSASFPAELKDFIAPITLNITNCGTVNIHKVDDLDAPLEGAVFTLYTDNAPLDGAAPHGAEDTATTMTCTTDASGDCSITDVPFGNYWAVETTGVPNHDLADDQSFSLTASTPNLTITLADFVDPRQPGAILITKTAKDRNTGNSDQHPLAGATFDVTDSSNVSVGGGTSNAQGEVCVGGLTIGDTYTVTETAAPTGYNIDTTSKDITITGTATCSSGDEDTASFTDSPLTDLVVTSTSEVSGVTNSQITCTDASSADIGDSPSANTDPATVTANGLEPGTYTCVVVIDP